MSDQGDNNFITYIYRGEDGEIIPDYVTRIIVDVSVRTILRRAFQEHPNIVEVICHNGVERIEEWAFYGCPNLRQVIMPGVIEVELEAFLECEVLEDVECGKLEIIGRYAFQYCLRLRSINLPSARIVGGFAFHYTALTNVRFGSKLERIDERAFSFSPVESMTIPLKDGIFTADDIFQGCRDLKRVDVVEGALHDIIDALQLKEWKDDMNEEIDSINQILPNARVGHYIDRDERGLDEDDGEKAQAMRRWIRSILGKVGHYQEEHQRVLREAATTLQFALPRDIAINNVLPFLDLPPHTFELDEG